MCANYLPPTHDQLRHHFGVAPPDAMYEPETFPGQMAPMIRLPRKDATLGERACTLAMFGMVPHWAELSHARRTYNARNETVVTKPTFKNAFQRRQFCIVPLAGFFEPNYESGKPVRWEISAADNSPLGIAGIWAYRRDGPNGLPLLSMSMLTVNADDHPLMKRFHAPNTEKRMVVILAPDQYDDWLNCPVEEAPRFFVDYPAELMKAQSAPKPAKTRDDAAGRKD